MVGVTHQQLEPLGRIGRGGGVAGDRGHIPGFLSPKPYHWFRRHGANGTVRQPDVQIPAALRREDTAADTLHGNTEVPASSRQDVVCHGRGGDARVRP